MLMMFQRKKNNKHTMAFHHPLCLINTDDVLTRSGVKLCLFTSNVSFCINVAHLRGKGSVLICAILTNIKKQDNHTGALNLSSRQTACCLYFYTDTNCVVNSFWGGFCTFTYDPCCQLMFFGKTHGSVLFTCETLCKTLLTVTVSNNFIRRHHQKCTQVLYYTHKNKFQYDVIIMFSTKM